MPRLDIQNLAKPEIITNQDLIGDLRNRLEKHIVFFNDEQEAGWFYRNIGQLVEETPRLKNNYPDINQAYQSMIIKAGFIGLPLLSAENILDLMENNFTAIFEVQKINEFYSVWEKVKTKLVGIIQYEDRDVFKKKIRETLLRNKEKITAQKITVQGTEVEPTIGSWLKDYNAALGLGPVNRVKQAEYLTDSKNIKNVSLEEKDKLKMLFNFYEKLKYSSMTPEGLEENVQAEIGRKPMVFREGELIEAYDYNTLQGLKGLVEAGLVPGVSKVEDLHPAFVEALQRGKKTQDKKTKEAKIVKQTKSELVDKLKFKPAEEDALQAKVLDLTQATKKDSSQLQKKLLIQINPPKAAQKPDKLEVLAILQILAETASLDRLLKDNKIQNLLISSLKSAGKNNLMEGLKVFPEAPEYLSHLLQFILKEKLGMDNNQSAIYGLRLTNLMKQAGKKMYSQLVYYDLETKQFAWKE
ncbi:MAG TPA: hypothetical protein VGA49_00160 [Patescibacteria group bacterium]